MALIFLLLSLVLITTGESHAQAVSIVNMDQSREALVLEAGLDRIREKSLRQTEYLVTLWKQQLEALGVMLKSPVAAGQRGSHVAFGHPQGMRIAQALIDEMHVVPDFRRPDNIRFGISPLYTTFGEIREAVSRLRHVITERMYEKYGATGMEVT